MVRLLFDTWVLLWWCYAAFVLRLFMVLCVIVSGSLAVAVGG